MVSLEVRLVTLIGNSEKAGGRLPRLTQNSVSFPVASATLRVRCVREGRVPAWLPGRPGSVICTWDLRLQEQACPTPLPSDLHVGVAA